MPRKRAEHAVNRDDIISAAADVLRRNGYEATTMKDIAAQVNLTAASLYHHFPNKDTLLLAVLEGGLDLVISQLEPVVHTQCSAADKLSEMVRLHVTGVTSNTAVGAAMVFEVRPLMTFTPPPRNGGAFDSESIAEFTARRDRFFARRDYFEELFRCVVREGINKREFREVDVPVVVKTMLGAHNWVAVWYRDGGRLDGEAIAAIIADTFVRSLLRDPS